MYSEELQKYAYDHSSLEDAILRELVEYTQANVRGPMMQTGHLEGSFLRLLVKSIGAKRVLEVGTYTGYSSLSMAMGLPDDGEVITCDNNKRFTEVAQRFWEKSPHGKKIQLKLGFAVDSLKEIEGPFDLAFIDADKENYVNYYEAALEKLRPGGLIVIDNVLWGGRVLDPQDHTDHAIIRCNEHVAKDDRVEAVMLTIRDGVTLVRKK